MFTDDYGLFASEFGIFSKIMFKGKQSFKKKS